MYVSIYINIYIPDNHKARVTQISRTQPPCNPASGDLMCQYCVTSLSLSLSHSLTLSLSPPVYIYTHAHTHTHTHTN